MKQRENLRGMNLDLPEEEWMPTHYVIACRGMAFPVQVLENDGVTVQFVDASGSRQSCHVSDLMEVTG
tara:strand:+ start:49 stop:252 length:204 start_codon:yes stop_codon:yes gene_type:complete